MYNTGNSDPTGSTDGEKVRLGRPRKHILHLHLTLRPAPCALRPPPSALRPPPCAPRPVPCALHPTHRAPTPPPPVRQVTGGFGHLGMTVPDVYEACARFASLGCEFTKTPNAGGMKGARRELQP